MELESLKNGTGFMTMLITMTWVIQTKAKSMLGLSLEDHLSIRILVEAGQDANQPRQVKTFTV